MDPKSKRFEIQRVANIAAPDGTNPVHFEVHEIFLIDGVEKRHRNVDLTFRTREEAEAWVSKQTH